MVSPITIMMFLTLRNHNNNNITAEAELILHSRPPLDYLDSLHVTLIQTSGNGRPRAKALDLIENYSK